MSTLRTTPIKANELFAQIADTSPASLKTRDRLVGELKRELDEISQLEETHLLPILRKRPETKELGVKLVDSLKERSELLAKLAEVPRESDDFRRTAVELKRAFQQHIRDEKNEFLPAIDKALSEDEAAALLERMEADRAQMEDAERRAAEARTEEARQRRAQAAEAAQAEQEAATAARKSARKARKAADEASQALSRSVAAASEQVAEQARSAASQVSTAVDHANLFATALVECNAIAREGLRNAATLWIASVQEQAQTRARNFVELANCRSPLQLADVQRRILRDEMRLFFGAGRTPAT